MMTGYPHTHIYIYRCRLMMHINRNEPTYTIGKQVFRFLQSSAVYLLSNLMWLSSFIISLCIYIHMCVSVCMCLLHLSRAKIFGTMRATSASAATRALSPMFLPRRWLSGGTGVPMLGSNSLPWKPEKLLWRRQVSWYPNISGSSHQKKPIFLSECSDDIPIGKWQGRVILQGTVELWGKPGKLHQNFGGKILYQKCIIMHLCISWGYGGCITSITNPHWWPLVDLAAGVTIADWAKEFDVQSPICVQKFEKGNKWMNIWMPWIYRWMDG